MAGCFQRSNFQCPHPNHVAVADGRPFVLGRRKVRDVNRRSGALRQLDVARDKVRVRMGFQYRDNLEFLPIRGFEVIAHVPLGVNHSRLP